MGVRGNKENIYSFSAEKYHGKKMAILSLSLLL